ncbi:MAG: response regulator [Candidatus Micrarchaeota archaeon]
MTLRQITSPLGPRVERSKKTVLIVDDEPMQRIIVDRVLKSTGHTLEVFETPLNALVRFKKGGIDLVLTDRQMPEMDGYQLTEAILAHDPKAKVVMITGMAAREDLDMAIDAGCVGVIAKPYSPKTLQNVVEIALQEDCAVEPPMGIRLNALVVTDEETGTFAMAALNMAGYKTTAANSITEAGSVVQDRKMDIVIVDYSMLHFDEILRYIRQGNPDVKIIVIANPEQLDAVEQIGGISNVLVKPVDNQAWERAVKDATAIETGTPEVSPVRTKATVLVVDDTEDLRMIMEMAVSIKGHPTKTASDGREALEIFKQGGIDLVLTDLEMPNMNGLELLRAIKAEKPDAKVVVLTAKELTAEERAEIMAAGALEIVAKPFNPTILTGLLETHATI